MKILGWMEQMIKIARESVALYREVRELRKKADGDETRHTK
jgi:hypothetical protein